ncbi:MAG: ABC transporter ATP-binding protein [Alistipes sp.]|nr:ABC transporter ATP-binding protein [Alistipes sp.]
MIRLENISLGYGSRRLLDNASATFEHGTLTALLGRNGAGKSTLLRAIASIGNLDGGTVSLGGDDIKRLHPEQIARLVSFVTTDKVRIPNLTCQDVVALGRAPYTNWIGRMQDIDREIVAEALAAVGMSDFANKTMDAMSDGECQRVMIARALAQQTPIILLDEPTAFLDLPTRHEICSLLHRLAHEDGKTILFSTHDLDIAMSQCDMAAIIDSPNLIHKPMSDVRDDISRIFGICQ